MSMLSNGVFYELSLTVFYLLTIFTWIRPVLIHTSFERPYRSLYRAVSLHYKYLWMLILLIKKKKLLFFLENPIQRDGEKGSHNYDSCPLVLLNIFVI